MRFETANDTELERAQKKICGLLIKSARMNRGLTQSDIIQQLSPLAQSTLSRIESGALLPNILLWYDLCELLAIPIDALRAPSFDIPKPITVTSGIFEDGYRIPKEYKINKCIGMRFLAPIFYGIFLDQDLLHLIKKRFNVHPEIMLAYSNQISLNFLFDLLDCICEKYSSSHSVWINYHLSQNFYFSPFGSFTRPLQSTPFKERLCMFAKNINYFLGGVRASHLSETTKGLSLRIEFDLNIYKFENDQRSMMDFYLARFVEAFINFKVPAFEKYHISHRVLSPGVTELSAALS